MVSLSGLHNSGEKVVLEGLAFGLEMIGDTLIDLPECFSEFGVVVVLDRVIGPKLLKHLPMQ